MSFHFTSFCRYYVNFVSTSCLNALSSLLGDPSEWTHLDVNNKQQADSHYRAIVHAGLQHLDEPRIRSSNGLGEYISISRCQDSEDSNIRVSLLPGFVRIFRLLWMVCHKQGLPGAVSCFGFPNRFPVVPHRVTFSIGHTGVSRKSTNDAPGKALSQRLSRSMSAIPWH